jgi:hypothetical protein
MVDHGRRIPREALAGEMRSAAGAHALQALRTWVREHAGPREAHAAAQGLFTRRLPMGLAAMPGSCAQRGPGDGGPAIMRAAGVGLARERQRRGRAEGSRGGTCAGARTGDRTPGAPGIFPLDVPVNRPARGSASGLPEWMPRFAVEPPCHESPGVGAQRWARDRAESGRRAVAQEAPAD